MGQVWKRFSPGELIKAAINLHIKVNAKNIHNDTDNEREIVFYDELSQVAILKPSDGCYELWECCHCTDPRRGVMIARRHFRFVRSVHSFNPGVVTS